MNVLITGGAGFIGTNTAIHYLEKGDNVTVLDNFFRRGSKKNAKTISSRFQNVNIEEADVRDGVKFLKRFVSKADVIFHLAGQVAVTSSVDDPRSDFEANALGTFNMLEAVRISGHKPIFIYSSTNKVYGGLETLKIKENKTRYSFVNLPFGVSENQNLDFHSPYGCSKGAADQYVRDYERLYDIPTIVFRQSCIYGPHQFGIEDQGWVAWFIIAILKNRAINIYGNGKQVRDILHVNDLINAFEMAVKNIKKTRGQIYNIGGGRGNTLSVWHEFNPILEKLFQKKIKATFSEWRPGDQPIYISDIRKAKKEFGWSPDYSVDKGVRNLFDWISAHKSLF